MSVLELDKIDAIGEDKKNGSLHLLIADTLGWEDEELHLLALREKINMYLGYIGDKKYEKDYGVVCGFIIDVHLSYPPTEKCVELIREANRQFNFEGVYFELHS